MWLQNITEGDVKANLHFMHYEGRSVTVYFGALLEEIKCSFCSPKNHKILHRTPDVHDIACNGSVLCAE